MKSLKEYMIEAETTLAEKAESQQQQKFMGMVHAMQKGKKIPGASKELKKASREMKPKDVKDFAKTKHKGLPKKVGESAIVETDYAIKVGDRVYVKNHLGSGIVQRIEGDQIYVSGKGKFPRTEVSHINPGLGSQAKDIAKDVGRGLKTFFKSETPFESKSDVTESRLIDESGETLTHIKDRFRHEVKQFEEGAELDSDLFDALFDYYFSSGEMPYGVAKARTGNPHDWIADRFAKDLGLAEQVTATPVEEIMLDSDMSDLRTLAGLSTR